MSFCNPCNPTRRLELGRWFITYSKLDNGIIRWADSNLESKLSTKPPCRSPGEGHPTNVKCPGSHCYYLSTPRANRQNDGVGLGIQTSPAFKFSSKSHNCISLFSFGWYRSKFLKASKSHYYTLGNCCWATPTSRCIACEFSRTHWVTATKLFCWFPIFAKVG